MAELRFNQVLQYDQSPITGLWEAERFVRDRVSGRMIFMSHKTGDDQAEQEAKRIVVQHRVAVYMAEWDENVKGDTDELPDHIMDAIEESDAFLVHVIDQIKDSMWIGYEVGGAHAMSKARARIMRTEGSDLPSVVRALKRLDTTSEVDAWIICNT